MVTARAHGEDSFRVLARTSVPFRIDDPGTALRACQPLIDLDPYGRVRGVRFNNRSIGTVRRGAWGAGPSGAAG